MRTKLAIGLLLCFAAQLDAQLQVRSYVGKAFQKQQVVTTSDVVDDQGLQISTTTTEGPVEVIGDVAISILEVTTEAANITIYADDLQRNPVEVTQLDARHWMLPKGKAWVEVRVVDFQKNIFDSKRIVVDAIGPSPIEPTPPNPNDPAPIKEPGLRVMIVAESALIPDMPRNQSAILFSLAVREYLNAKCVSVEGTSEWRIFDPDTDFGPTCDTVWCRAMGRERKSLPWVLISNGTTGFEGPLPANVADFLELVKVYEQ